MAASMTGMTQEEYAKMMLQGGRAVGSQLRNPREKR
jgi:hypothetical protein